MANTIRAEIGLGGREIIVADWTPPAAGENIAIFVHGLGSNRRGEKALHFAEGFARLGWGFLSLDLRGHGESTGSLEQLTLSRCLEDLAAAVTWIPGATKPRLLIGSSMGGAVAAWYALLHPNPDQLVALIAPSLRFPGRFTELPPEELDEWRRTKRRRFASEWIDIQLGYEIVEDAMQYSQEWLKRDYQTPTLVLHGMLDTAVPWQESVAFSDQVLSSDIELMLIKNGDHRLTAQKAYLFGLIVLWLRQKGLRIVGE